MDDVCMTTLEGLVDEDICQEALLGMTRYLEDKGKFSCVTKVQTFASGDFLFAGDNSSNGSPSSTSSSPSNLSLLLAASAQETQVLEAMKVAIRGPEQDVFYERHVTKKGCSLLRLTKSFKSNLSELGHGCLE